MKRKSRRLIFLKLRKPHKNRRGLPLVRLLKRVRRLRWRYSQEPKRMCDKRLDGGALYVQNLYLVKGL